MIATLLLLMFFGFIASVGLGPVTILVIKRGMQRGQAKAWFSGIGAGLVDSFYGSIAFFGVQTFIDFINEYQAYIRIGMGAILAFVSAFLWLQNKSVSMDTAIKETKQKSGGFLGSLLLALGNPMMVLVYLGIFTLIPMPAFQMLSGKALIVFSALLLGTCLWWGLVSFLSSRFSEKISEKWMSRLNQIAALLMLVLALYSGISGMLMF